VLWHEATFFKDEEEFLVYNKAFTKITYGMYIISSSLNGKLNGMIATTACQVTSDPPAISVTINKENLTHEFIQNSGIFSVSILSKETSFPFIGRFGFRSGREIDKFEGVGHKMGKSGVPIVLDNATGYIEAKVKSTLDVGTHTIFIADVVDAEVLSEAEPMTYAYYHEIKGGKSPKAAPTYMK